VTDPLLYCHPGAAESLASDSQRRILHSLTAKQLSSHALGEMERFYKCRCGRPRPRSAASEPWTGQRTTRTEVDQPSSPTDCHPDRSFSSPKGMRSGVEGPAVSYMDSNGSGNENRRHPRASVPQPRLASK